jgi:hypothetical protein
MYDLQHKVLENITNIIRSINTNIISNYLHDFCISKYMHWRDKITIDLQKGKCRIQT